jgi:hypothetical protein
MNQNIEKLIESLPKKKNSIKSKLLNQSYFLRSTEFNKTIIYKSEVEFNSKDSNKGILLIIGLACLFISIRFKDSEHFITMLILSIIGFLGNIIFLNCRKGNTIRINKTGFEIENTKFDWNDIYDFGVLIKPNKYMNVYHLILFSNLYGKKEYNLFSFKNKEAKIVETMIFFKDKFNSEIDIS